MRQDTRLSIVRWRRGGTEVVEELAKRGANVRVEV